MCNKPIADEFDDLEAFRRLAPKERMEQLILKLETDEAFVNKFKDEFHKWEQQEDDPIRASMYKWLRNSSCGTTHE